jgi:endonuclease G|tara:strand:+ start:1086 stop:1706 length:621 start_codon:yes stop_codon:yes gene_type:complete
MYKYTKLKTSILLSGVLILLTSFNTANAQDLQIKHIKSDIFTAVYSERYQQPLEVSYTIQCPTGSTSRKGLNFYTCDSVETSDNKDYVDNIYDKGHLAPAAAFNCDRETLKKTFTYLNCALQHQSLNRGPWKELERFERNLAKVYAFVSVTITVHFNDTLDNWLPTGALVPTGFSKIIWCDGEHFEFYFPNTDVKGQDWITFKTGK